MTAKFAAVAALTVVTTLGLRRDHKAQSTAGMQCGSKGSRAASLGEPNISIVNGQPASECDWIWQVSMEDRIGHFCGGMLIDPQWVLTAAHCLGGTFDVRVGSYNRDSSEGQLIGVAQQIEHPSYNSGNSDFDIALLRLERPVQLNNCVGTVCLPQRGDDVAPGSTCWITGWGTLYEGGPLANRLQEVQVDIMSNAECKASNYTNSEIKPSMLCAQGKNSQGIADGCQGDSGGPLVCESGGAWRVYGATSWGVGCAEKIHPGVWARVHYVLDWIESYVGGGAPSPSPQPTPPSPGPSPPSSSDFVLAAANSNSCPSGYRRITESECEISAGFLGYPYRGSRFGAEDPGGCWLTHRGKISWNRASGVTPWGRRYIVCGK